MLEKLKRIRNVLECKGFEVVEESDLISKYELLLNKKYYNKYGFILRDHELVVKFTEDKIQFNTNFSNLVLDEKLVSKINTIHNTIQREEG